MFLLILKRDLQDFSIKQIDINIVRNIQKINVSDGTNALNIFINLVPNSSFEVEVKVHKKNLKVFRAKRENIVMNVNRVDFYCKIVVNGFENAIFEKQKRVANHVFKRKIFLERMADKVHESSEKEIVENLSSF